MSGRRKAASIDHDKEILQDSRDPLINRRHGELASFLKRVFYQLRVGERWLLWSVRSWGQEVAVVGSVGETSRLIRILPVGRRIFVIAVSSSQVAGIIRGVQPSVRLALVACGCAIDREINYFN